MWHLEDRLPDTNRLLDLVEQRVGQLSAEARWVVELLALCQPLELGYLEATTPVAVLESLERAGLVTIPVDGQEVRLAHPVYGRVVRAAMPRSRARAILLAQADRLEAATPVPGSAALRIAIWRLDAGGRPDPAVLIRGAHLARYAHDFRVVRRLIEAVPGEQLDAVGALLLGEALYELGVFDAADRILARGQQLPGSEHVALRLAVTRAKNAQWGLCQPEEALAINAAARAVIISAPLAEELVAEEASVLTFSGQPGRALAMLDRLRGGDRRTRVARAIAGAPALAMTGRTAEAVKVAEAGYADHVALGDELAIAHPAMHLVNQAFALTEAGRLAEAEQLARAGTDIVASQRVPIAQIFFAVNLGRIATLQGRMATARRHYAEATGLAQASHFAGPQRIALSGLALAHAMLGDADAAAQALADRATGPAFGFRGPEQQLADAWTAMASQRSAEAAQRLRDAAAQAASTGHRTAESWLLHDLMRIGGQETSARLRDLAEHATRRWFPPAPATPPPRGTATPGSWLVPPATLRPWARCCWRPRPRRPRPRPTAATMTGAQRQRRCAARSSSPPPAKAPSHQDCSGPPRLAPPQRSRSPPANARSRCSPPPASPARTSPNASTCPCGR